MRPLLEDYVAKGGRHITMPRWPTYTVAATGSTTADAAALREGLNHVTGADATVGVILPTPSGDGAVVIVKNSTAANAVLKVYPPSGKKLNDASADTALAMAAKTAAFFWSHDGVNYFSLPLLPS